MLCFGEEIDPDSGRVLSVTQVVGLDDDASAETDDLTTSYTYTDGSGDLPEGLLLSVTDPDGTVTLVGYDDDPTSSSFGLATSITEAHGTADAATTTFTYDAAGNVASLSDDEGNTTSWVYLGDLVTQETVTIDSVSYTRSYVHNDDDQLWIQIDRNGRAIEYLYDEDGNVEYEKWYAAGDDPRDDPAPSPVRTIVFSYDDEDRLFGVDDAEVDFTYTYDAAGYVTQTTWDFADLADDVTFDYDYSRGELTGAAVTIGSTADYQNAYEHDPFGRLTRIEQSGQSGGNAVAEKCVDLTYTDDGRMETITRYADLAATDLVATTTYSYDPDVARLTGLVHELNNASQTQISYGYTYSDDGQIDTLDSSEDGLYDYDYDETGQLTDVDLDGTPVENYDYDGNGNRTNTNGDTYTTTAYNRLETVDDGTSVTAYGYDPEGNLTLKFIDADESGTLNTGDTDIIEYTWDHRNRLVGVTNYDTFADYQVTSSQEVEYTYDYLNRLVARTIDEDGVGVTFDDETEYYVYDGGDPGTAEQPDQDGDVGQIVLQLDENGSPIHRYLWGPAVDQILADEVVDDGGAEDVNWTLTDHQNSVRDLVEYDPATDTAAVVNHITYDAYGNTTAAVDCVFASTARFRDEATGLQNHGHRWYDPLTGRWRSEDPIGFEGGDANLYGYCGNEPTNEIDHTGLAIRPPWAPWEDKPDSTWHPKNKPSWLPDWVPWPIMIIPSCSCGAMPAGGFGGAGKGLAKPLADAIQKVLGTGFTPMPYVPSWGQTNTEGYNFRPDQLPPGEYSPNKVDERMSQRRKEMGLNRDPNTEIPDMKPGAEGGWGNQPAKPSAPRPPKAHKPRHGAGERGDHATPKPPTERK